VSSVASGKRSAKGHGWRRRLGFLALVSAFAQGCAAEVPGEQRCAARTTAALFYGSPDAGALALPAEQALAIGGVRLAGGGSLLCTATLIDAGLVVTAAHCGRLGSVELLFGASAVLPINELVMHPDLDLMLIEVDPDLVAATGARPIALFRGAIGDDWRGQRLTLAGLGQTESGSSGERRFVEEQVVKVTGTELWVDGMGASGACGGDSGGPLLARDDSGAVRVAGVLDRGSRDCLGIDVYTRADVVAAWMRTGWAEIAGEGDEGACW
jgi:hypothetical protein